MFSPSNILVVTVLSSIFSLLALGSLVQTRVPGVGRWVAATCLATVALACFALQGHAPVLLSIVVANVALAAAMAINAEGFREYFGLRACFVAGRIGCAAVLAGIVYFLYVSPSFDARVVVVSIFHACLYSVIAATVFRHRPPGRPGYSYQFVGWTSLLCSVGHIVRGGVYAFALIRQERLLDTISLNVTFLALGILALPLLSIGMVMIAHDHIAERLESAVNLDELTGAWSRRAFFTRAAILLEEAAAPGGRTSLAIIDLDHFKRINDTYGHAGGDFALRHFVALVKSSLRGGEVFARLGGEEFGLLCPWTSQRDAAALLESLSEAVGASACMIGGVRFNYTFSAGVAEYRRGEPLSSLMARADAELYRAKASGRNQVLVGT